jgi:hypothetical protein
LHFLFFRLRSPPHHLLVPLIAIYLNKRHISLSLLSAEKRVTKANAARQSTTLVPTQQQSNELVQLTVLLAALAQIYSAVYIV